MGCLRALFPRHDYFKAAPLSVKIGVLLTALFSLGYFGFLIFVAMVRAPDYEMSRAYQDYMWTIIITLPFFTVFAIVYGSIRGCASNFFTWISNYIAFVVFPLMSVLIVALYSVLGLWTTEGGLHLIVLWSMALCTFGTFLFSLVKRVRTISEPLAGVSSVLACAGIMFPLTAAPLTVWAFRDTEDNNGQGSRNNMLWALGLLGSLSSVALIWLMVHVRHFDSDFLHHEHGEHLKLHRRLSRCSSATIVILLAIVIFVLYGLGFSGEMDGRTASDKAVIASIMFMAPFVVIVCVGFQGLNMYNKEKMAAVSVFVIICLAALFPIYRINNESPQDRSSAVHFLLYLLVSVPIISYGWTLTITMVRSRKPFIHGALRVGGMKITFPIASGLCCVFVLLPLGLFLPLIISFGDSIIPGVFVLMVVFIGLFSGVPALAIFIRVMIPVFKTVTHLSGKKIGNGLSHLIDIASDNAVSLGSWLASSMIVFSIITLLAFINLAELADGTQICLIVLCAFTPIFAGIGFRGSSLKGCSKYFLISVFGILLPALFAFVIAPITGLDLTRISLGSTAEVYSQDEAWCASSSGSDCNFLFDRDHNTLLNVSAPNDKAPQQVSTTVLMAATSCLNSANLYSPIKYDREKYNGNEILSLEVSECANAFMNLKDCSTEFDYDYSERLCACLPIDTACSEVSNPSSNRYTMQFSLQPEASPELIDGKFFVEVDLGVPMIFTGLGIMNGESTRGGSVEGIKAYNGNKVLKDGGIFDSAVGHIKVDGYDDRVQYRNGFTQFNPVQHLLLLFDTLSMSTASKDIRIEVRELYLAFADLNQSCVTVLGDCPAPFIGETCDIVKDKFACANQTAACSKADMREMSRIMKRIGCKEQKPSQLFTYFLGVGFPVFTMLMMGGWVVSDFFRNNMSVIAITAAVCCFCVFFPFGVLLPSVLSSQFRFIVGINNAIGTITLMCMTGVCCGSMVLNVKIKRMEAEKTAKVAVYTLRKAVKKVRAVMDATLGRLVYDEFHHFIEDNNNLDGFRDWMMSQDDVKWNNNNERMCVVYVLAHNAKDDDDDEEESEDSEDQKELIASIQEQESQEEIVTLKPDKDTLKITLKGTAVPAEQPKPLEEPAPRVSFFGLCCGRKSTVTAEERAPISPSANEQNTAWSSPRANGKPNSRMSISLLTAKQEKESVLEKKSILFVEPKDPVKERKKRWRRVKKTFKRATEGRWLLHEAPERYEEKVRVEKLSRVFNNYCTHPKPKKKETIVEVQKDENGRVVYEDRFQKTHVEEEAITVPPYLSLISFKRFVKSLKLKGASFNTGAVSVLYVSLTKKHTGASREAQKTMDEEVFQIALKHIAVKRYPNLHERPEEAFNKLLIEHVFPNAEKAAPKHYYQQADDSEDLEDDELPCRRDPFSFEPQILNFLKRKDISIDEHKVRALHILEGKDEEEKPLNEEAIELDIIDPEIEAAVAEEAAKLERWEGFNQVSRCCKIFSFSPKLEGDVKSDAQGNFVVSDDFDSDDDEDDGLVSQPEVDSKRGSSKKSWFGSMFKSARNSSRDSQEITKTKDKKKKKDLSNWTPPTWESGVECVIDALTHVSENDVSLHEKDDLPIKWSASNVIALFSMFLEWWTLTSIAFSIYIPWNFGDQETTQTTLTAISAPMFVLPHYLGGDSYLYIFGVCIALAVIYPVFAFFGIEKAKKGTLGMSSDGKKKAKPCTWNFWYAKLLSIIGATLYQPILINMVYSLKCDVDPVTEVSTMYKLADVYCWQGIHYALAAGAVIATFVFYPSASFMFPNMQFMDKSLDIKYDPTFLIFLAQAKLFLAGVAVFFPTSPNICLIASALSYSLLAGVSHFTAPCLVKRINRWKTASFISAAWACASGLIVVETGNSDAGLAMLGAGWLILLIISAIRHKQQWGHVAEKHELRHDSHNSFGSSAEPAKQPEDVSGDKNSIIIKTSSDAVVEMKKED